MTDPPGTARSGFVIPSGVDATQLQLLAEVTAELAAATNMDEVAAAAVSHIAAAIRARRAMEKGPAEGRAAH